MLIGLAVLCFVLSGATSIWALVIIFKRSIIGGLLTLFFALPMLYFLVTGWGKEGEDIKKPFFLSIILWGIGFAFVMSASKGLVEENLRQMSAPPARSTPSFREPSTLPTPSAESTRISNPPAPQATGVPRTDMVKDAPRRKRVQSDCVYKPVMTDEDIAKCR